ncbi:MAG: hypothetical protein RI100_00550 [Nitrosarchaeum sp.]|jgi:hypothetical protein|uniref:hypothetical protein n=1 Tax=Nitrosarchaeum sp. TaxID=2026886 RepID=UPI002DE6DB28|nr:hypothetical protein [Nitrosarchaeum sp.]
MTEWHTISAKFTSREKKILDILRDEYGLSHNQSLRGGLELFVRILAMCEYYVMSDSKIMKKISRVGEKSIKQMDADVKKILENIPRKQQDEEYEKFANDSARILSNFDKVFVKNRKRGRKSLKTKRGRPSTKL